LFAEQEADTLMKSLLLDETHNEFNNQFFLLKTKKEQENLSFSFNLKTPRLFKFYSFKPMSIPFTIYVTPGDTLSYKLDNSIITFKGTNASHYNFFKELYALKLNYPRYNEELGVSDFKKTWEIDYQKKLHFLEQYVKDKNVSDLFYTKIKDVFKFQYINGLINRNILPKGVITNYSEYLQDITINIFNRNDQDDNVYFYSALTNYLYLVSEEKFGDNTYSTDMLDYQIDLVNTNLVGKTKEYAITKMIFEFDSHLNTENANYLKGKIKTYLPQIKDKKHKIVLKRINERLNKINTQLAEKVYNSILLDIDGTIVTLKEILKNQGNKIKVIDFWASWCAPCIKEIKKSHLYREKLIQDKNVEFLYFSVDKNQEDWRKKVAELKEFGVDKNQYTITKTESSDLIAFFNVSTIPHYAIIDNKNNVFLSNSPAPSDTIQFNDIIKKIEELE
jgi:thiol-disulfide isomerase/thioredoxin